MFVELYDTTLRDGSQAEGVTFSVEDKLRIAIELDKLGVHYIEGGFPGSNPKDVEFFEQVRNLKLQNAKIVAFGSTRRADNPSKKDTNLNALLKAGTDVVTLVGKSWTLHVDKVLRVSLEKNLELIEDSVGFLASNGREVIYDAEHFFDGYKENPAYAIATLQAAVRGGAKRVVLCDTNGGTMPLEVKSIFENVINNVEAPLGIHTHNDAGMGVANSIIAIQAGATQVQGTFNGYGERCGNANLGSIIPNLKLKLGLDCITDEQLTRLTSVSRLISELANLSHDERQSYVGKYAFAHKGGLHIDAVGKTQGRAYEHIVPELVGNERRILVSDQAGRSTIIMKLQRDYPELRKDSPEAEQIFKAMKEAEKVGYQYEGAEASFELLTRKALGNYKPFFQLLGFRGIVEKFQDFSIRAEATVKVKTPDGIIQHTAAEGVGPVDALNNAFRKALEVFYPSLKEVRLTDYKVRALDTQSGTEAKVRVLIESSDGKDTWGTVGVSYNSVDASWEALVDSFEYKLLKDLKQKNV